jgi:murein DD-endopeptidase MepM/ murein hydrolase activator NlpD
MSFSEETKLMWPIEGNVILDYNMDNTIYFPTLDSYKCNPAIVIQGEEGTEVMAGVTGIVEVIAYDDEIGQYVTLNLGNDYKLTFGQLENIVVEEGQTVSSDTCIGVVGEPTKYYSKEGNNLYYMLTKNDEPCDPLDYLS